MGIYMGDGKYVEIKEVPARLEGKRALALKWLLEEATTVSMLEIPRGRSRYKVYFDDGAYKGGYEFIINQQDLTPLTAYLTAAKTGWPGHKLEWLEDFCEERMKREVSQ